MHLLRPLGSLFAGASVLDVGCHAGRLSVRVADELGAARLTGIDIDPRLITKAADTLHAWRTFSRSSSSPVSPSSTPLPPRSEAVVEWLCGDVLTHVFSARFDVVMCMCMTKWVHVNGGDAALRALWERLTSAVRPGGLLVLQPQPWESYGRIKHPTVEQARHMREMQLRPEGFVATLEGMGMQLLSTLIEESRAEQGAAAVEHEPEMRGAALHQRAAAKQQVKRQKGRKKKRRSVEKAAADRPIYVLRMRD